MAATEEQGKEQGKGPRKTPGPDASFFSQRPLSRPGQPAPEHRGVRPDAPGLHQDRQPARRRPQEAAPLRNVS